MGEILPLPRVDAAVEEPLALILDAMVDSVFVADASGRVLLANEAMRILAERDPVGHRVSEIVPSPELVEAFDRVASGGASEEIELKLRLARGRKRWLTAQLTSLPRDGRTVVVLHDITQLKRTEGIRRDFVANASHELRTPLTAIAGFAETLSDGALDDPATARRFVSNIRANATRLMNVVEDLLALSRAESPESVFVLEAVDVVRASRRVIDGLEPKIVEKRLTLKLERADGETLAGAPIEGLADVRALDQILLNLIDNAIKYTPEGGTICVCAARDEDAVRVDVKDTGPGILPKYQDRIFERFYRVDKGRSREQGGTGLGLSIVRNLVGRIGGQVTVESDVGVGSTFSLRLRLP